MSTSGYTSQEQLLWPAEAAPQAFLGLDCGPDGFVPLLAVADIADFSGLTLEPQHLQGHGVFLNPGSIVIQRRK